MKTLPLLIFLIFSPQFTWAETPLAFPTTADEFVQALTPKPPDSTRQRKGGESERSEYSVGDSQISLNLTGHKALVRFES